MATVVLGAQWGDEGKGKIVDVLSEGAQLCCRAQGGHNAGHTIVKNDQTFDVHILREYHCDTVSYHVLMHWARSVWSPHSRLRQPHRNWMRGLRSRLLRGDREA